MTWGILLVCLLIHALVCLGVYLCRRAEILKFSSQAFPLVALVPVWGLLAAATAEWNTRRHKSGAKLIDLEDLHINDYRLLGIEEESTQMPVVPLEEAFLINDAATRRRLMVEILRQDPNQYIQLLQQARLNDDIEVTHYASTAMMEVQREYEIDLLGRWTIVSWRCGGILTAACWRTACWAFSGHVMASCWTKSGPAAGNRIAAYGLRRRRTDWRCGSSGWPRSLSTTA